MRGKSSLRNTIFMDSGTLLSKRIKKATYKDVAVMIMSMQRRRILVLLKGNRLMKKFFENFLGWPIQII